MTEQPKDGGPAFPKMSAREEKVLAYLDEYYDRIDENCHYFWLIADGTGLDKKQVRRAARSLARKGLTKYVRGLFDEDGQVAGSGYCCTQLGHDALAERVSP